MWDNLRISTSSIFSLLAGCTIFASATLAAPYEEKMLALPPANKAASMKDYDQFYRIIVWTRIRLSSCAFSIYISHETPTRPNLGFISFKAQKVDGTFWERSRHLTRKEIKIISDLFEKEKIFSQSETPSQDRHRNFVKDDVKGPGVDYFVHIDKVNHKQVNVKRVQGQSNSAQRVVSGLAEIVEDYLKAFDKDPGSVRGSWEAEETAISR